MEFVPLAIGGVVGVTDGIIGETSLGKVRYARTVFRTLTFATGAILEITGKLSEDINYGLMTAASSLIGAHLPGAFISGPAAMGYSAPVGAGAGGSRGHHGVPLLAAGYSAPVGAGAGGARGHHTPGCTTCGAHGAPVSALGDVGAPTLRIQQPGSVA